MRRKAAAALPQLSFARQIPQHEGAGLASRHPLLNGIEGDAGHSIGVAGLEDEARRFGGLLRDEAERRECGSEQAHQVEFYWDVIWEGGAGWVERAAISRHQ